MQVDKWIISSMYSFAYLPSYTYHSCIVATVVTIGCVSDKNLGVGPLHGSKSVYNVLIRIQCSIVTGILKKNCEWKLGFAIILPVAIIIANHFCVQRFFIFHTVGI